MKLRAVTWTDDAIVAEIMRDVMLAHASGFAIDMQDVGLAQQSVDGRTVYAVQTVLGKPCSICAVGALLIGEPVLTDNFAKDLARYFGRSYTWAQGLFNATAPENENYPECSGSKGPGYRAGWKIGKQIYLWVQREKHPGGRLA